MADITITIPVAQEQRVADAFTFVLGGTATLADVKSYIIADLIQFVRNAEKQEAAAAVVVEADPVIT